MFNFNTIRQTGGDKSGSVRTNSPTKMRILELVRSALPSDAGNQQLSGEEHLSDLGLTSLRFISLVILLEDEFGLNERFLEKLNARMTIDSLVMICDSSVDPNETEQSDYC